MKILKSESLFHDNIAIDWEWQWPFAFIAVDGSGMTYGFNIKPSCVETVWDCDLKERGEISALNSSCFMFDKLLPYYIEEQRSLTPEEVQIQFQSLLFKNPWGE